MKPVPCLIVIACFGLLVGCAANIPPPELADARQAYSHASATPTSRLVPVELREAREALIRAEESFRDDGISNRTLDLAALAYRKAKLVAALGVIASDSTVAAGARKDIQSTKTEIMKPQ